MRNENQLVENVLNIYCDGGSRGNPGPAASAFIVFKNNKIIYRNGKFLGRTTNNVAEYMAVIYALSWLIENYNQEVVYKFHLDSELVVNQLNQKFKLKDLKMKKLFYDIKILEKKLDGIVKYLYIKRTQNKLADYLVNSIMDGKST